METDSFVKPQFNRWFFSLIAIVFVISLAIFTQAAQADDPTFVDVPFEHPYHDHIEALYQERYVATDGNDNNPGTEASPWRTIQHAVNTVEPGDTIWVKEGTYAGAKFDHKYGQSNAWITIQPYPGHRVVVDRMLNHSSLWRAFQIHCSSYIEIKGLILTDSNPQYDSEDPEEYSTGIDHEGIKISKYECTPPHHIRIIDNEIFHTGFAGIYSDYESHHNEFINNHIHHVGLSKRGHAMYIGGDDHVIRGNIVHDAYGLGIAIYSANGPRPDRILVEENIVFNNGSLDYGAGTPDENYHWNRMGDGIKVGGGGVGNIVRNNLVFGNMTWGIRASAGSAGGTQIINNTVYGNGYQGIYTYDGDDILVRNNISLENKGEGGYPGDYYIGPGNPNDHNSWNLGITDARFVDPGNGDFHLLPTSPAVDSGTASPDFSWDIEGTSRPQGAGWDLGAYEYSDLPIPTFADVPFDHWAHDEIELLYQEGYVAGCSTDPLMYCPEQIMTRAESAVFVGRGVHGADYVPVQPNEQIFADVPLSEWFAKWSTALWEDGYTGGCGTDPLVYCPLQEHTRAEGSVFFLRMMHGVDYIPPDPQGIFTDVSSDWWGANWVEAAYNAGLIPACETDPELRFCPYDPLDRAMGATMMVQAKELEKP